MIQVVDGIGVGAGKSYFVCGRLLGHLAAGGTAFVADTFGFNFEEAKALISERLGVEIEPDQYREISEDDVPRLHEVTCAGTEDCPVLVVVDEAQGALNARDWNDTKKRGLFNWLCQSRHDDNDVIFISQSANNIDKQVRRLVTEIVRCVNLKQARIPLLNGLPFFVQLVLHQDGTTVMSRRWVLRDRRVFRCYRSKSQRGKHRRLTGEIPRKSLKKVARPTSMKAFFVVGILLVGFLIYGFKQFGPKSAPVQTAQVAPVSTPVPAPVVKPPVSNFVTLKVEAFRGFIADNRQAILHTDSGWYQLGEISGKGLVVGLSDRRAAIITPTGSQMLVIAEDRSLVDIRNGELQPVPSPQDQPIVESPKSLGEPGIVNAQAGEGPEAERMRRVQAGLPVEQKSLARSSEVAHSTPSPAIERRRELRGLKPVR